jgi:hypothetical protein
MLWLQVYVDIPAHHPPPTNTYTTNTTHTQIVIHWEVVLNYFLSFLLRQIWPEFLTIYPFHHCLELSFGILNNDL